LRRQHVPIVALQSAQSTHLQATFSKVKRRIRHGLKRMFAKQQKHASKKTKQTQDVGICRGNKLRWWIKVKKKCVKAYGRDSKWDRNKLDGKCAKAWKDCTTGFYAVCCSQPMGAKNMEAYCAGQALTFHNASDPNNKFEEDKACQVQTKMKDVKNSMSAIKGAVNLLGAPVLIPTTLSMGPGPGPAPAPAQMLPPVGLMGPAPSPAPAPTPAQIQDRCAMLTELTRQAAEKIKAIKQWAEKDGMKEKHQTSLIQTVKDGTDSGNAEAKDPDLAFSVKGVIQAGEKLNTLLKNPSFCGGEDDDDDDDVDQDPTEEWEGDDEAEEITINETAIIDLLDWESGMTNAVDKFEKEVHPHGFKWWRYRYEYTIVESVVLAFSVMLMYLVMWLLHGVSFFQVNKFYKTGVTSRLLRYAWAYLVFHAATLMVMVTCAYMLYIPWGKQNIFNWFAEAFHDLVDGHANVPFLGYSWLYMVLDVQFQLFVCFALYSLFVVFVALNYQRALEDWKTLSQDGPEPVKPVNKHLYEALEAIIKKRVQNTPEYRQIFHELKLRLPGVTGLDTVLPGWCEFKLHLYLTDGLGMSMEYLVQVSLTTNIFLACSALAVATLAHHYQVAFMYFLPGFLFLGLLLFAAGFAVARHFRALSENDDHNTPAKYVTVRSYCRAVQIILYCVLFSFSRLLLSNDIFEFYPKVYLAAVIGLLVVLVACALVAPEIIKETACALILPPHIPQERFKAKLEQVVNWHTLEKCHECGVQQFPAHSSLSREWAGKRPTGERKDAAPDSSRPFSFRG